MSASRWIAWLSLVAATLIGGFASYFHALTVVQAADGHHPVSYFIPFLADLVIASAAANMFAARRSGQDRPLWSMLAAGVGIVATLYMNWKAGNPASVPTWLVNVWPPVAFGLTLESLVGLAGRGDAGDREAAGALPEAGAGQDEPPSVEDDVRDLLSRHSVRQVHLLTHAPRARLYKLAKAPEMVSEAVSANGSGPHEP